MFRYLIQTPPATTTITIRPVCPKCGVIAKSGKNSCCSRGGAWFRNCGGTGNTKQARHTWYEGIRACNTRGAQLKAASGQRLQQPHSPSDSSNAVKRDARTFAFASANTSTPIIRVKVTTIIPATITTTTVTTHNRLEETRAADRISQGMCMNTKSIMV